jgi:hypothetical protein
LGISGALLMANLLCASPTWLQAKPGSSTMTGIGGYIGPLAPLVQWFWGAAGGVNPARSFVK